MNINLKRKNKLKYHKQTKQQERKPCTVGPAAKHTHKKNLKLKEEEKEREKKKKKKKKRERERFVSLGQ